MNIDDHGNFEKPLISLRRRPNKGGDYLRPPKANQNKTKNINSMLSQTLNNQVRQPLDSQLKNKIQIFQNELNSLTPKEYLALIND